MTIFARSNIIQDDRWLLALLFLIGPSFPFFLSFTWGLELPVIHAQRPGANGTKREMSLMSLRYRQLASFCTVYYCRTREVYSSRRRCCRCCGNYLAILFLLICMPTLFSYSEYILCMEYVSGIRQILPLIRCTVLNHGSPSPHPTHSAHSLVLHRCI